MGGLFGSTPKVAAPVEEVVDTSEEDLKKRKALYETEEGVLGEEVDKVGATRRNNVFGN